jgi:hypothetical protein
MRKLHDDYEDPISQIILLFLAVVFLMVLTVIPAIWARVPYIRLFNDSGSRAVIESCVAEKGAWNCLKAFGTALDEQTANWRWDGKGRRPSDPDRGLIETIASVVPARDMLDSCGRTPECIIFMADHGYAAHTIVGELER